MTAKKLRLAILAALSVSAISARAAEDRTAWFRDAKFGMFIHWGAYSVAGLEASWPIMKPEWWPDPISPAAYEALPKRFNPTSFDAKAWVQLAQDAGQKYIIFTAKHHDGFDMFDADNNPDYKITKTPYGKDVFAQLTAAAHDAGMPIGFYYSPPDMHQPGYRDMRKPASQNFEGEPNRPQWASYLDYMEGQLRQLLTRYGDIAVVWFDGFPPYEKYQGDRFHSLIHELQPKALINDRIGPPGDFDTPEQTIPSSVGSDARPWESCMTINGSWAYNPNDHKFKSTEQLVKNLVDIVSKGGNYLLDVGPDSLGLIQPEFRERLEGMGAWLRANGEAIYGTRPGPLMRRADIRTTAKGNRVFIHVFDFPASGRLSLEGLPPVVRASVLATGQTLVAETTPAGLDIILPAQLKQTMVPVIALDR